MATTQNQSPSSAPAAGSAVPPGGIGGIPVTADNFIRAESDLYFAAVVKEGGLGKFEHHRDMMDVAHQNIIRLNRDTLYSAALFDLDAGPVMITLPDPGKRFMSMMSINEDHYIVEVVYGAGTYTYTRDKVGTRYVMMGVRTLVDPANSADLDVVHKLQDKITASQKSTGSFEAPHWDPASQKSVREALLTLGATLPDMRHAFGTSKDVDPIRHLIGSASAWGGNPDKDAVYLNVIPPANDGKTRYVLTVKDVPVDGFWSVSVYNADGYYEPNSLNAYSLNNLTARQDQDGGITIRFGGSDPNVPNLLPIVPGWNYMVRLYRPRGEILDGSWRFPEAQPLN